MSNLTNIGTVKEILMRYGFTFSKAIGQNFLINPSVCPQMADKCGLTENTGVIEIGPGIGVLTYELASRAKKVVAIELDRRLLPILNETLINFNNIKIINDDIMKIDLKKLIDEEFVTKNKAGIPRLKSLLTLAGTTCIILNWNINYEAFYFERILLIILFKGVVRNGSAKEKTFQSQTR